MAQHRDPPLLLQFGDFSVNPRARTLHKHGVRLKLHGQPFEILLLLLARPGDVITREELQAKLWSGDTFVDFEHSLNTAIKKLRQTLGDSAGEPRFIETVPRIGYRFSGQVAERIEPSPEAARASETGHTGSAIPPSGRQTRKQFRKWILAAGIIAVLLVSAFLLVRSRSKPPLTETDLILISDFANATNDPVFDDTLKQAVSVQLSQSPFLNILSDAKIFATLRLMMQPVDTKLTPDIAQDVCQRAGAKAYIAGSIASLGKEYVIGLNAVNCQTGDILAQEQVSADGKDRVLQSLGQATASLRQKLGESLASIQKFDTPIDEATTPSLEALKFLSVGKKIQQQQGNAQAIPYFNRAIQLDPNFAAAYAALGTAYSNLREPALASHNLQEAYELRNHVSERERFRISAYHYHLVTGELEQAIGIYELWAEAYPRDNVPRSNLGVVYGYLGRYDKAVSEITEDIRLNPGSVVGYVNLTSDYMALNRLSDAKATYQQASARKLDNPFLHLNLYGVAFLQGDTAEMQRQVAWSVGNAQAENLLLSAESDTEAYWGHLGKARELSRRASESAEQNDQKETAAEWQMNAALREAEFGNAARARQQTDAVFNTSSSRDVQLLASLTLARVGDSRRAEQMADDLAKRFPLDTAINGYWLPAIRAAVELSRKKPATAVEILKTALPYELGNPLPQAELGAFLYPVYLRAQSYLQLHQGKEAAVEFQKFLGHRGITVNCPLGALAQLGLARAYSQSGSRQDALRQYQQFLALWNNADADIPILQQAKTEYAKAAAPTP